MQTVSEDSESGRAIEIVALVATLFFLAVACGVGWFLRVFSFGTLALGTGSHPWIPIAYWAANILVPIVYVMIAFPIYRRWKSQ